MFSTANIAINILLNVSYLVKPVRTTPKLRYSTSFYLIAYVIVD